MDEPADACRRAGGEETHEAGQPSLPGLPCLLRVRQTASSLRASSYPGAGNPKWLAMTRLSATR